MTKPLSPAAAAVMIAATNGNFNVVDDPVYKQCIAAALRALAVRINGADAIRQDILDIADELDAP